MGAAHARLDPAEQPRDTAHGPLGAAAGRSIESPSPPVPIHEHDGTTPRWGTGAGVRHPPPRTAWGTVDAGCRSGSADAGPEHRTDASSGPPRVGNDPGIEPRRGGATPTE